MLDIIGIAIVLAIGTLIGAQIMDNREALANLQAEVALNNSVVESAITLVNGLSNRITDLLTQVSGGQDISAGLEDLRSQLDQQMTALGNAVAQNTISEGDSSAFPPTTTDSGESTGATVTSPSILANEALPPVAEDAEVNDSAAGVDEEIEEAEEQVPDDAVEALPEAGEVVQPDSVEGEPDNA